MAQDSLFLIPSLFILIVFLSRRVSPSGTYFVGLHDVTIKNNKYKGMKKSQRVWINIFICSIFPKICIASMLHKYINNN